MIKNIFDKTVANEVINRINRLSSATKPQWGKMSADQMPAHLNVQYAFTFQPENSNLTSGFLPQQQEGMILHCRHS